MKVRTMPNNSIAKARRVGGHRLDRNRRRSSGEVFRRYSEERIASLSEECSREQWQDDRVTLAQLSAMTTCTIYRR
jgi:hypothetical protein